MRPSSWSTAWRRTQRPPSGACSFLVKDIEPEDLARAVRVAARGDSLLSPAVTRSVIEAFVARPASAEPPSASAESATLTEREREIVRLVGAGLSNDEIARKLVVSPLAAKTHVSRADDQGGCAQPGAARGLRLRVRIGSPRTALRYSSRTTPAGVRRTGNAFRRWTNLHRAAAILEPCSRHQPEHIVGISKTTYVLATPRCLEWRHDLQRTSTNNDPSDSQDPCRRPASRHRGARCSPRRPVAGVLVLDGRITHRRPSQRAPWSSQ
jgi:DNA-binding CsgD family transcriptional regulator